MLATTRNPADAAREYFHVEASPTIPSAPPASTVKAARINGHMVNLHTLATSYRICALAAIYSFLIMFVSGMLLARRMELTALGIFLSGQLATGIAITIAFRRRRLGDAAVATNPPPLPARVFDTAADVLTVGLCAFPILGLMPAADLCGRAHRIFNTLGVPVGLVGPSQAAINALRLGLCHTCGYDINHQPGDTCPECGSDISGDRQSAASGLKPVTIDRVQANDLAGTCDLIGYSGLALGTLQLVLVLLIESARREMFLITWLLGFLWGLAGAVMAARALRVLAARGTVDHAAVLLSSLISPLLGAALLLRLAFRLRLAAKSGTSE